MVRNSSPILDANFLGHLLSLFADRTASIEAGAVAATMALAVTFDFGLNPTFATHEYRISGGQDDPNELLRRFYRADNVHPSLYAEVALGHRQNLFGVELPNIIPSKDPGDFNQVLRGHGFIRTCVLKIVAMQTNPQSIGKNSLHDRVDRLTHFMDWMYYEFLYCGPALILAEQLWGNSPHKCVLKKSEPRNLDELFKRIENACWDLNLAMNWADFEQKRRPNLDPIQMLFTRDRALEQLALMLLLPPNKSAYSQKEYNRFFREQLQQSWPADQAERILTRYLQHTSSLESSERKWNQPPPSPGRNELQRDFEQQIKANLCS